MQWNVFMSLTQLLGTLYNICKGRNSNPRKPHLFKVNFQPLIYLEKKMQWNLHLSKSEIMFVEALIKLSMKYTVEAPLVQKHLLTHRFQVDIYHLSTWLKNLYNILSGQLSIWLKKLSKVNSFNFNKYYVGLLHLKCIYKN